jgi:hypothetical protein
MEVMELPYNYEYENPKYIQACFIVVYSILAGACIVSLLFKSENRQADLEERLTESLQNKITEATDSLQKKISELEDAVYEDNQNETVARLWQGVGTIGKAVLSITIKRDITAPKFMNNEWLNKGDLTYYRDECLRITDSNSWRMCINNTDSNSWRTCINNTWVSNIHGHSATANSIKKEYTMTDWDSHTTVTIIFDFPDEKPSFETLTRDIQYNVSQHEIPSNPRIPDDIKWGATLLLRHFANTPDAIIWHRTIDENIERPVEEE